MKRALILIITLTLLTFGCGSWLDALRRSTAQRYLDGLYQVQSAVLSSDMDAAIREQAYLHALWLHDTHWLNALIDHHHTRDVDSGMRRLATSLDQRDKLTSLLMLDEVIGALEEVAQRDVGVWENIL